jgi:hypothetical protein
VEPSLTGLGFFRGLEFRFDRREFAHEEDIARGTGAASSCLSKACEGAQT